MVPVLTGMLALAPAQFLHQCHFAHACLKAELQGARLLYISHVLQLPATCIPCEAKMQACLVFVHFYHCILLMCPGCQCRVVTRVIGAALPMCTMTSGLLPTEPASE